MTRFVKNPYGAVHSVPDDFEYPIDFNANVIGEWSEAAESDASPALSGAAADPQVEAAQLHNRSALPVKTTNA